MSFKSIVRELREMKDGIGNVSRRGSEGRRWRNRARAHIAPDQVPAPSDNPVEQSQWANLPSELLLDIIKRVEESEMTWPARAVVVFCASVCKSWRDVTKETVRTPEQCGMLTFPISLKQPGHRDNPIQCFIKRDRANSTYLLFCGLSPSEGVRDKMLLAARKIRRATCTDFVISLVVDDFSRISHNYMGKLKSNFLGTKFTIYDNHPPCESLSSMTQSNHQISSRRFNSKQSSISTRRLLLLPPPCNYSIGAITYELNVLRTRGPRRMHCILHSIPISSIQEGGTAPTPTTLPPALEAESFSSNSKVGKEIVFKDKDLMSSTSSISQDLTAVQGLADPLVLKNKAPRWHEQLQCWCLNFRGRVTVASVKNFQLVAAVDPSHNISTAEQDKVILQFGKIGKDIFTMDYRYPLSAFQAFAICLSSFDTKPACE